jgi:crotonobetainyl-CoA:carnitine CoA-transferase CaiB-like acyl-CoA transferase
VTREVPTLLDGMRVVDFSTEIAGPYASKLLADSGADVVKVEAFSGDPLRLWSASRTDLQGRDGALFRYLHTSKRSVVGGTDTPVVRELLGDCELVLESGQLTDLEIDEIRKRNPSTSVVSVTPFGRTGPWRDRAATEFTLQALCGSTAGRGSVDRPPLAVGGRLGEWIAGTYTAVAALAATLGALRSDDGERVDISMLECMTPTLGGFGRVYASLTGTLDVAVVQKGPFRTLESPSIEPSSDGLVGFCTVTGQQFQDFLVLIERPDLVDDRRFATAQARLRHAVEFSEMVRKWTEQRTTAEIVEQASLFRIPVTAIGTPTTIPEFEQCVEREVYQSNPDGDFIQPRVPYKVTGVGPNPFTSAPHLGQHSSDASWRAPLPSRLPERDDPNRPLESIRILDLTAFWAGPAATQILGALGADVIKIESAKRPDGMRFNSMKRPSEPGWWEWSPVFQSVNTDKRSLTLDLTSEDGLRVFHELVLVSDVVIENFSPRVLDSFGISWDGLHALNDQLIMVRMPGFGLDGPWRDRTGFAQTMEQISGMAWVSGFVDGLPVIPRGACDPLAGMHAVVALLAGLRERHRSGQGRFIEVAMVEAALNTAAELVIEQSCYGVSLGRDGNHGPVSCPQGVYACDGTENWLAIAIATDAQWSRFVTAIGNPPWSQAMGLATDSGRRLARTALDTELTGYFAARNMETELDRLTAAGIPAAPVVSPACVLDNDQVRFRRFPQHIEHEVVGDHDLVGLPFIFESVDEPWFRSCAPLLGEHNSEILVDLLGYSEADVAQLHTAGIIGDAITK